MKNLKNLVLFMTLVIVLSSCASILSKSTYPITLNTSPVSAKVKITNKKGETVYEGNTPALVKLKASSGFFSGENYTLVFQRDGYETVTRQINSKIDGWYWGNILFGGLVGMIIVDPATGAMYKLDTESIDVGLAKTGETAIIDINSLPSSMKDHLVLISKEDTQKSK